MTCTNPNIGRLIGGYELGLLTREEKRLFEKHLQHCDFCFNDLYKNAPAIKIIREGHVVPSCEFEITEEEDDDKHSKTKCVSWTSRLPSKRWIYGSLGTAALLAVVFVTVWLFNTGRQSERLRGQDNISILVVSPVGEIDAFRELRWKEVPGVETYEPAIYTETGQNIWRESVRGLEVILPASVSAAFVPGRIYIWQVEAKTDEGEVLKSQMIRFWIQK